MVVLFVTLLTAAQTPLILFLFPVWDSFYPIYIIEFLSAGTVIFYLLSKCKDPGYVSKPKNIDFLNLLQLIDPV